MLMQMMASSGGWSWSAASHDNAWLRGSSIASALADPVTAVQGASGHSRLMYTPTAPAIDGRSYPQTSKHCREVCEACSQ